LSKNQKKPLRVIVLMASIFVVALWAFQNCGSPGSGGSNAGDLSNTGPSSNITPPTTLGKVVRVQATTDKPAAGIPFHLHAWLEDGQGNHVTDYSGPANLIVSGAATCAKTFQFQNGTLDSDVVIPGAAPVNSISMKVTLPNLNLVSIPSDAFNIVSPATPAFSPVAIAGLLPAARFDSTSDFDPKKNRLIVFGGRSGARQAGISPLYSAIFDETWALNLNLNPPEWVQLSTTSHPSARYGSAVAIDTKNNRMILFGGLSLTSNFGHELWALDLGTDQWSQLISTGTPSPYEADMGMAFDSTFSRMVFVTSTSVYALRVSNSLDGSWVQLHPQYENSMPSPTGHWTQQWLGKGAYYDAKQKNVFFGSRVVLHLPDAGDGSFTNVGLLMSDNGPNIIDNQCLGFDSLTYDPVGGLYLAFRGSAGYLSIACGMGANNDLSVDGIGPTSNQSVLYDTIVGRFLVLTGDQWPYSAQNSLNNRVMTLSLPRMGCFE
jgi:hypothetical protein